MTTQRIKQLFDTLDNYSISYWNILLKYAEANKLKPKELEALADKSEEFRQYWNTPVTTTKTIVRDGVETIIPKTRNSLDIDRDDVSPNIHLMLNNIKHNKES